MNKDNNDNGGAKDKDRDMLDSECSEETTEYGYDEKELEKNFPAFLKVRERENRQAIAEEFLERDHKKNIWELDIEAIFEDTIQAYKDENQRKFEDNMTIIFARYYKLFYKKINYLLDYNNRYKWIKTIKPKRDLVEEAFSYLWLSLTAYIKYWVENGRPEKDFKVYMAAFPSSRAQNYFNETYLNKDTSNVYKESGYDPFNPKFINLQENENQSVEGLDEVEIIRERIRNAVYSIFNTNMRADKVIGTAYRRFLDYSNQMYWHMARDKSFITLFDIFIGKAKKELFIDPNHEKITEFKIWLNSWEAYEEKLGRTINGHYIIRDEYIKAKDIDLTRWASGGRRKIREGYKPEN